VELGRERLSSRDPGPERVVDEGLTWLARAQDCSASRDGGVARHFSLNAGWSVSYPETTGYIVPTLLSHHAARPTDGLAARARRMIDWLVSIQLPGGGFQGGVIGSTPVVPVTFNTGQILMGLAAAVATFGPAYEAPMRAAADWLAATQDPDGCWRRHPSPFAASGEKTYDTHVAWGLVEAARVAGDARYLESALKNVRWALTHQAANGWFDRCCLDDPTQPYTHTIGYVLRGLVETYLAARESSILEAALRTALGSLAAVRPDGFLPGRLNAEWQGTVTWTCLTGMSQIAISYLQLFELTGDARLRDGARALNRYVRRTVRVAGPAETRGAVKGSYPVHGAYGRYEYLNWAVKFTVDANARELATVGSSP
jgi:hypothetical protein